MVMEEMSAAVSLFARDLSHLEKLIKSVNSPWVKAGLDLIQAENNAETISDFCSRLGLPAHVHFADRKEGYAALGKGDFAFAGRLEELEQLGYKDTISLSCGEPISIKTRMRLSELVRIGSAFGLECRSADCQ